MNQTKHDAGGTMRSSPGKYYVSAEFDYRFEGRDYYRLVLMRGTAGCIRSSKSVKASDSVRLGSQPYNGLCEQFDAMAQRLNDGKTTEAEELKSAVEAP